MHIRAQVIHHDGAHESEVSTEGRTRAVAIPAKEGGPGAGVNGGELLFLALATCYCNDVYREAAAAGIRVERVEVEVEGRFAGVGDPATSVRYRAHVTAAGSTEEEVRRLMQHVDRVAEVHNTLRVGTPVELADVEVTLLDAP